MLEGYNIFNVIWDFVRGRLEFADSHVTKGRMDICNKCEVRNEKLNVCTICGCYLPFKTRLTKSSCPMEKW